MSVIKFLVTLRKQS